MSNYGLSVIDAFGNLQIDGDFFNYKLVQSGFGLSWVGGDQRFINPVVTIPFNFDPGGLGGLNVLILIRPPIGVWASGYIFSGQFGVTPGLWGPYSGAGAYTASPQFTFEYKIFLAQPSVDPPGDRGLSVRGSDGQVVFDSREEYFSWEFATTVSHGGGGSTVGFYGCWPEHNYFAGVFPVNFGSFEIGVPWIVLTGAMRSIDDSNSAWFGRITSNSQVDFATALTQYVPPGGGFPVVFDCNYGNLMVASSLSL